MTFDSKKEENNELCWRRSFEIKTFDGGTMQGTPFVVYINLKNHSVILSIVR